MADYIASLSQYCRDGGGCRPYVRKLVNLPEGDPRKLKAVSVGQVIKILESPIGYAQRVGDPQTKQSHIGAAGREAANKKLAELRAQKQQDRGAS